MATPGSASESYRELAKDNYDGMAIYDANGKITYASPALHKLLGYRKRELWGKKGLSLIDQEDEGEIVTKYLKLINKKKKKIKIQHRLKRKDGSYVWVLNSMQNYLKDSDVRGVVSNFRDISEEKESEEEFNLIYEDSKDGIFVVDYHTKIIKSCNSRAIEMFERRKKNEFIGEKISVLWNDLWSNRLFNEEMEGLEHGMLITREQEYYTRKANKFWGNTTISLVDLPTSRVYLIRITDMRDQLKESRDYEIAINQFAASLIDSSTEDEIVWDVARNIKDILKFEDCVIYTTNDAGNRLIQRASIGVKNPEGNTIKNSQEVEFGKGIAGSIAQSRIAEIVNDVTVDDRYMFDEFQGASEIAVPIMYEDTILGVIDSENSKKGFFTSNHMKVLQTVASFAAVKIMQARANVQLVQNEQKLQAQNEELKKINAELDRFVYSTSHDLRAPLANIAGLIEIIRFEKPPKDTAHCLDLMDKSINKLDDFITDILRYSRNKRVEIKRESVDFKKLIDDSLSSLGYDDKTMNVRVNVNQKKPFYCDNYRLQNIFNNLISNSFRYKTDRGIPYLNIKVDVEGKKAKVIVEDNGIGIEEKHLPKIFDMFYRATNKTSGSGLGLFIVKETVELLKGRIRVNSKPNEGTTFVVDIPGFSNKKG